MFKADLHRFLQDNQINTTTHHHITLEKREREIRRERERGEFLPPITIINKTSKIRERERHTHNTMFLPPSPPPPNLFSSKGNAINQASE